MKVKDNMTGCTLESDNAIVTGAWEANPDRFAVVDDEAEAAKKAAEEAAAAEAAKKAAGKTGK